MFNGMMGKKMQEMKLAVEESKKRLDKIIVKGEVGSGAITVEVTGNRRVKDISINLDLIDCEKKELQNMITIAINRALVEADQIFEHEMASVTKGLLPSLPGMQ